MDDYALGVWDGNRMIILTAAAKIYDGIYTMLRVFTERYYNHFIESDYTLQLHAPMIRDHFFECFKHITKSFDRIGVVKG